MSDQPPVCDTSTIATLRACGEDAFADIVGTFLGYVPQRLEAMREALVADDREALAALAHSCKGACAGVGALRLAAAARQLEEAVREGADPAPAVAAFAQAWAETEGAYRTS